MKQETLGELRKKYKKVTFKHIFCPVWIFHFYSISHQVTAEECEEHWQKQFDSSAKTCSHAFWKVIKQCWWNTNPMLICNWWWTVSSKTCNHAFWNVVVMVLTRMLNRLFDGFQLRCISGKLQEQDGRNGVRGWSQAENLQCPHRFLWLNYFT